ncbi:MAG: hypothetical protein QOD07_952 [Frankiaceae bacterium]|nr:hypothetical protein [Frankiaceae bacterium]
MRLLSRQRSDLRVFISYRREDSAGQTGRLADGLIARLGRPNVYVDVDSLAPGLDFVDQITTSLDEATVVLAVIGRSWATVAGPQGRRLDDENDYVRLELESALARDVPVIPVLVGGAQVPPPDLLPASISRLSYRHAFELSDSSWTRDLDAFVHQLQYHYGHGSRRRKTTATPPHHDDSRARAWSEPESRRSSFGRLGGGRTALALAVLAALVLMAGYLAGVGRGGSTVADYRTVGSTSLVGVERDLSWSPGVVTDTLMFAGKRAGSTDGIRFVEVLPANLATTLQAVTADPAGVVSWRPEHGLVTAVIDLPDLSTTPQMVVLRVNTVIQRDALPDVERGLATAMKVAGAGVQPAPQVLSVSISPPAQIVLHVNERRPISALVVRAGASRPDSRGVRFDVSPPGYATVANGLIVGQRVTGSTQVLLTATAGTAHNSVIVDVVPGAGKPTPIRLSLTPGALSLPAGLSQQLAASEVMSFGPARAVKASWSARDPAVATVTPTGLVAAAGPGETVVTARAGALSATAVVTVSPAAPAPPGPTPVGTPTAPVATDHQPKLDPISSRTVSEGGSLTVPLRGSDPDGNRVSYALSGSLPAGLTFNSSTHTIGGTVRWNAVSATAAYNKLQSKSFAFKATVYAGGKSFYRTFTITVVDTKFQMPNYVGLYGCGPGCGESPRDFGSYNHHFYCDVTTDSNRVDTIEKTTPTAGTIWDWTSPVTATYWETSCSS